MALSLSLSLSHFFFFPLTLSFIAFTVTSLSQSLALHKRRILTRRTLDEDEGQSGRLRGASRKRKRNVREDEETCTRDERKRKIEKTRKSTLNDDLNVDLIGSVSVGS